MIFLALEAIEIYNGLFSLIFVLITLLVGLRIASKYFSLKDENFLYVGFGWIGVSSPWIAATLSFLIALINDQGLSDFFYFLIGVALIPIYLQLWMTAFANLLYPSKRKQISIIFLIINLVSLGFFLFALFFDISLIGVKQGIVDTEWSRIMLIYFVSLIFLILITGLLFARESLKSSREEIRLKGKFLSISFILYAGGAILDSLLDIPITRIIMMISAITFYFGWIPPDWIKRIFVKEEHS